jgi:type II secretory pathway pseudopilin PulG
VIAVVVAFLGVFVLGILASLAMPAYNQIAERAEITKAMNNCKQLILGCRMYAADNGGAYPPDLQALYPDYLDIPEIFVAVDKRGVKFPIVYHSGFSESSDAETVFIEYPVEYDGKRIVGRVGGFVDTVPVGP